MVYSSPQPEYENILISGNSKISSLSIDTIPAPTGPPTGPSIQVLFNGKGLHQFGGPVPFISLSKTYNRNNAGNVENIQTNVTIDGKIVRASGDNRVFSPGTGVAPILGAISGMQDLFRCTQGLFQVLCYDNNVPRDLIRISGARVNSFNVDRSDNNWIFTADYRVELEYNEPGLTGLPPVKNTVDTWNVEPLEDAVYSNFKTSVSGKAEYSNPLMKPAALNNQVPSAVVNTLSIVNIPQFKISRRLSAVGFPMSYSSTGCPHPSGDHTAYLSAKKWVELKLKESFRHNGPSGAVSLVNSTSDPVLLSNFDSVFLFNHLRTINFSISDGSYEVNDTWLAMPTGMSYIEDYTLETSTDEKYIKTVRVQGNIKGLSFAPIPIMSGGSGLIPITGWPGAPEVGKLSLGYSMTSGDGLFSSSSKVLDNFNYDSHNLNKFQGAKYHNALSGWINDIKPYLYRRASLVLNNASDRNDTYISPIVNPIPPPKNPIYCRENLLNTIPISTTEGHDPRKGTISYSYEYNNKLIFISGAISENITIDETGPADVINEAFVIGRRLGPVLQSVGSVTSAKKNVSIEVVVLPPSSLAGFPMTSKECPLYTGGTVYKTITGIIEGLKPYGDRVVSIFGNMQNDTRTGGQLNNNGQVYVQQDTQTWHPAEGRYSRNIGWVYEACNISRNYLDH